MTAAPLVRATVAVAIAQAFALLTLPAHADTGGGSASGWGTDDGAGVGVQTAEGGQAAGGQRSGVACSYAPFMSVIEHSLVPTPGVGYYAIRDCVGQVDVVWVPNTAAPAVPAIELARRAVRELAVPDCQVRVAPPADRLVVQFPTWLWLEGCAWAPQSATAEVPLLSATVTATPTKVVWDMGDGTRIGCDGPGVSWRSDVPAAAQSTYCSYSYSRSSSGEPDSAYTVTATVRWELSWSATNGEGGVLTPASPSSSAAVRVGEVQTIVER